MADIGIRSDNGSRRGTSRKIFWTTCGSLIFPSLNKILVRPRKDAEEKFREAVKIASKFGDEDSISSEIIDEVTKENETEDEKSSKLVVNMITKTKDTQVVDPKQNQLTYHDFSYVNQLLSSHLLGFEDALLIG